MMSSSACVGLLCTNKNGINEGSLEGVGRVKVSGYRASSAQMTSITGDIIANYNTGLCKFLCGMSLRYFYQIPAPALHVCRKEVSGYARARSELFSMRHRSDEARQILQLAFVLFGRGIP